AATPNRDVSIPRRRPAPQDVNVERASTRGAKYQRSHLSLAQFDHVDLSGDEPAFVFRLGLQVGEVDGDVAGRDSADVKPPVLVEVHAAPLPPSLWRGDDAGAQADARLHACDFDID